MKLKDKLLQTGYFEDNEWLNKYIELVSHNVNKHSCRTQYHHILQRAYFKLENQTVDDSTDNLVCLEYSNHILAHYYLYMCTLGALKKANASALSLMLRVSLKESNKDIEQFIQEHIIDLNELKHNSSHYGRMLQNIDTGVIYNSITAASRDLHISNEYIKKLCSGWNIPRYSNVHLEWYPKEEKKEDVYKLNPLYRTSNTESVYCSLKDEKYTSIFEASLDTGLEIHEIHQMLNGEKDNWWGFRLLSEDEYVTE